MRSWTGSLLGLFVCLVGLVDPARVSIFLARIVGGQILMILFRPSRMKMAIPSICACTDSPLVGVRADALYSAGFRPKVWPAAVCAGLYFVSGTLHWIRELSLSLPECKTSSLTTRSDYFRTGRPRYMLTLTISMYSKYSFVTSGTMIFMLLHSNCTRLRIPYYIQSRR